MTQQHSPPLNFEWTGHARTEAQQNQEARNNGGDVSFLKLKDGQSVYFYLAPPFDPQLPIYRTLWKYFNLPGDQRIMVAWKSFDVLKPGFSEGDPIAQAVEAIRKIDGEAAKNLWASRKAVVNVIPFGRSTVAADGEESDYRAESDPGIHVLEMTGATWDTLIIEMTKPGMQHIFLPETAVGVQLARINKNGKVEYRVRLMGNKTPTEFQPAYENLREHPVIGPKLDDLLKNVPNLYKMWGIPNEEKIAAYHRVATMIREKYGRPGGVSPGAIAPDGSQNFGPNVPTGAPPGMYPPGTPAVPGVGTFPPGAIPGSGVPVPGAVPPPTNAPGGAPSAAPGTAPVPATPQPASQPTSAPGATAAPPENKVEGFGTKSIPPPPGGPATFPAAANPASPTPTPAATPTPISGAPEASGATDLASVLARDPTETAPRDESGQPVCFRQYHTVQQHPHGSQWCPGCAFKMVCEMGSPKA